MSTSDRKPDILRLQSGNVALDWALASTSSCPFFKFGHPSQDRARLAERPHPRSRRIDQPLGFPAHAKLRAFLLLRRMNDEDTYLTLEGPCEGLFKAKGSKHFGYGWPIHSRKTKPKTPSRDSKNASTAPGTWRTLGCSGTMRHNTSIERRRRTEQQRGATHLGGHPLQ